MKQEFKYEEEEFTVDNDENISSKSYSASIDEILEDAEEDTKRNLKDIFDNRKLIIGIVAGILIIAVIVIIFWVSQNTNKSIEPEGLAEEIEGEILFDENGFIIMDDEPVGDDLSFRYTTDEIKELREAGYTITEIEEFERLEVTNISVLIDEIAEQKKKSILEIYRVFLRDAQGTGNEEYLYALANTWLGLIPQEVNVSGEIDDYYKDSCNADFWKLPLQGYQPMLKVKFIDNMDIERTVFMAVDPSTYVSLRDSGNILITYNYVKAYDCEFIVNIQEVK